MIATQPGSALQSFLPPPIGSPVKGSRQLAAEGFLWRIDAATDTFISGDPVRGCAGNRSVSRNASALLRFATQTCRERICPFRLPRLRRHPPVRLTQKPYRYQRKYATKKPSPQAPQGEDNGVRCETLQCTCVTRSVTVFSIVPNRATRDTCIRSCAKSQLKRIYGDFTLGRYFTLRFTIKIKAKRGNDNDILC